MIDQETAARLAEIRERWHDNAGFTGGPDKRKGDGRMMSWCHDCSSWSDQPHDDDCAWLVVRYLLDLVASLGQKLRGWRECSARVLHVTDVWGEFPDEDFQREIEALEQRAATAEQALQQRVDEIEHLRDAVIAAEQERDEAREKKLAQLRAVVAQRDAAESALTTSQREAQRLREALERIVDWSDCGCEDHASDDCCGRFPSAEYHCHGCIAARALASPPRDPQEVK